MHNGHLIVARAAAERLALDQVRLVLARQQPFKAGRHGATAEDRLMMLRVAVRDDPILVVDERELCRSGASYTIDTLRELHAERLQDALVLLLGADAAHDLPTWKEAEAIPRLAAVVALTRPGVAVPEHPLIDEAIGVPPIDVSATGIRARCARGESIMDLVPAAVARYIAERRLYREGV